MLTVRDGQGAELYLERVALRHKASFGEGHGHSPDGSEHHIGDDNLPWSTHTCSGLRYMTGCCDGRGAYNGSGTCQARLLPYLFCVMRY